MPKKINPTNEQVKMIERARKSPEAVPELFAYLENKGAGRAQTFIDIVADDALNVEEYLLKAVLPENALYRECVTRRAAQMRKELEGENPSRLEKMLVEQIVDSWLLLRFIERLIAMNWRGSAEAYDTLDKRAERTQKRHLAAVKTLSQVRRLPRAAVQILGGQQLILTNQAQTEPSSAPPSLPSPPECLTQPLREAEPVRNGHS